DPFPDISRAASELGSVGLARSQEPHGIAVDEQHILEIDDHGSRFALEHSPQDAQAPPREASTERQDDSALGGHHSVDPEGHGGGVGLASPACRVTCRAIAGPRDNLLKLNWMAWAAASAEAADVANPARVADLVRG